MDRKSEKIADLAAMFGDIDLDVIENLLELCDGKVNRTAEMLLKMKDDAVKQETQIKEVKSPIKTALQDDFLEIDDPVPEKPTEEKYRNPEEVALENEILEQEYMAEMQKAIEMSLEPKKKVPLSKKAKYKFDADQSKSMREIISKNSKISKVETGKKTNEADLIVPNNPEEEVIQFIFKKNNYVRGENLKNIS